MRTIYEEGQVALSPAQHEVLMWLKGKSPVSVTEAMEQGLGRTGLSPQTVRVALEFLAKNGLVSRHKANRVVNNGFGYAASTGRTISVIKYSVK